MTANIRVSKDLRELFSTPNVDSPPILATAVEDKLDHVIALIVGPPDTPYHFGFYFFDLRFPDTYPNDPPKVKITTTDFAKTRFNPNLYADGKVCLSILGTWRGETSEVWRSSYSIAYVLNAIQSLIMNSLPYHNEPGYEEDVIAKHTNKCKEKTTTTSSTSTTPSTDDPDEGHVGHLKRDPELFKKEITAYSAKVLHENMRVAVCDSVEAVCAGKTETETSTSTAKSTKDMIPMGKDFRSFIKREFLMRYESYLRICEQNKDHDGQQFLTMPFEYAGNVAEGKYDYCTLISRLHKLKEKLEDETEQWKKKGKELTSRRSYVSSTLKDEHLKLGQEFEGAQGFSGGPVSDENAFHWEVTLFGPEGSLYEEGMFKIEIIFNEDPNEIPRVKFLSDMFHPNISPSGYPWFNIPPGKQDNVEFLLMSCKKLLTQEPNASPATWVNDDAAKMCFSREDDERKSWRKKARQLARRTMEE